MDFPIIDGITCCWEGIWAIFDEPGNWPDIIGLEAFITDGVIKEKPPIPDTLSTRFRVGDSGVVISCPNDPGNAKEYIHVLEL